MSRRRRSSAGFTMIELLIAGLMSALVLLAVYFVFIANTAQYYRQEQIVQMQESMRFAVELLKSDLRNAGRLAVVRGEGVGRDPRLCRERPLMRAVELFEGAEGGDPEANGQPDIFDAPNDIEADRLRLLIDAGNGAMFRTRRVAADAVTLAPADQQPTAETRAIALSRARMLAHFQPGSYVSISTPDNAFDMVPITQVDFAADGTRLTLAQGDDVRLCSDVRVRSCGQSCLASAVVEVEYVITTDEDDPAVTRLVRRLVDAVEDQPGDPAYLEDSELVMADHVVDFQAWGLTRDAAPTTMAQERERADAREDERQGARVFRERIQDVRALGLLLAVRTPREDPEFVVAPDRALAGDDRLAADRLWFEVDDEEVGLARVMTLKTVVEATNLFRADLGGLNAGN